MEGGGLDMYGNANNITGASGGYDWSAWSSKGYIDSENTTLIDYRESQEYGGYKRLLSLLGDTIYSTDMLIIFRYELRWFVILSYLCVYV